MKKALIIAALLCGSAGAKADCTMTSYSIVHNWAEGVCTDLHGNVYDSRTTYWDWFFDYGL
jgi:hypothetical protein